MKNLVCLLLLIINLPCLSQNKSILKNIKDIKFYGVDYSSVSVIGAKESPEQFRNAFEAINNLFITEPKKFNVNKLLKKNVTKVSIFEVNSLIENINDDAFYIPSFTPRSIQSIQEQIFNLPIEKEKGIGVVIIAKCLDKNKKKGIYQIIFFNLANKKIIDSWEDEGKAGGFGLRNYWGNSVYNLLK